jgi:hypothetical protein
MMLGNCSAAASAAAFIVGMLSIVATTSLTADFSKHKSATSAAVLVSATVLVSTAEG